MFSQKERLTRTEIECVLSSGQGVHGKYFTVRYMGADSQAYAVVISKKVAKTAVTRHLLKRRIAGVLRSIQSIESMHAVVIAKRGVAELSFEQVKEELAALFRNLTVR